jgi:hypothetical protein
MSPIVMGPPAFATISNVAPIPLSPIGQRINVYFDTDQVCLTEVDWYSPDDATIAPGSVVEAGPNAKGHSPVIDLGAPHPGKHLVFTIKLAATDSSGLALRPYVGSTDLPGTRWPAPIAGKSVPVRFYTFGDGTRPAGGGGVGNWSSYTWAQYNPKGT